MAEICVGIIGSGDASEIVRSVVSVLSQPGIDLELYLAVDADLSIEALPDDPRIQRVFRGRLPGLARFLDLLATQGSSPFICVLYSSQRMMPDSLQKIAAQMRGDDSLEMLCGLQFEANQSGHVSRERFHVQWEAGHRLQHFDPVTAKDFLDTNILPGNIRCFRKTALKKHLVLLSPSAPELVFLWRVHSAMNTRLLMRPLCIRETANGENRKNEEVRFSKPGILVDLLNYRNLLGPPLGFGAVLYQALHQFWRTSSLRAMIQRLQIRLAIWKIRSGFSDWRYRLKTRILSHWPIPGSSSEEPGPGNGKKIGYYIWQYPVLSQTFVQREVAALIKAGEKVIVFTENESEQGFLNELEKLLRDSSILNRSPHGTDARQLHWSWFRKRPIRYISTYFYIVGRNYHFRKDSNFDRSLFTTALQLASLTETHGIDHLHSPWADVCAFVALVASRLRDIPFSLQGRAHDIHRQSYLIGLDDKLVNAEFIVTNTAYNVEHIKSMLSGDPARKVKLIHNGLNLSQFQPDSRPKSSDGVLRLLCVARLIDQKGLVYLLQACRRLLDAGQPVQCDIVGGYEDIFMNYFIELKRMQKDLELDQVVHFAGSLPFESVMQYYRKADIFVLPCVIATDGSRDIIPNSVLEAMAMRLPVVSTTVTGLPEMVDDSRSGFLVPPHDVGALVSAIQKLAQSAELRTEFGLAARRKVESHFDSEINIAYYRELFRDPRSQAMAASE